MSGKYCINCKFYKRMPIQQGHQATMVGVCMHADFGDPVEGTPMPCAAARQIKELCGLEGKGYSPAPKEKDVDTGTPPKLILET